MLLTACLFFSLSPIWPRWALYSCAKWSFLWGCAESNQHSAEWELRCPELKSLVLSSEERIGLVQEICSACTLKHKGNITNQMKGFDSHALEEHFWFSNEPLSEKFFKELFLNSVKNKVFPLWKTFLFHWCYRFFVNIQCQFSNPIPFIVQHVLCYM